MIFTEFRFLLFFGLVFCVHWALRGARVRKLWLLVSSWAFYCAWDWRFLSLILISTAVDWVAGARIAESTSEPVRRRWLFFSLGVNLGLLGFFKYFGWFVQSATEFLQWLGIGATSPMLAIVLPVGISFYTFQTLSYTIDIYRRELQPVRSALDWALFVGFFPQLVAGPIVRAAEFLPQLARPVRFARVDAKACLILFLVGYFKKDVVSEVAAHWVVDPFFAAPLSFEALSAWIAVLFQLVVLYCDFSGYSDMALATAGLLGYRLTLNFNFPWFARNLADFWRRWHISLSTWVRDYVYRPLGGGGGAWFGVVRNTLLTMVALGLWHGAAWKFAAFGAVHGVGLLTYRAWRHSGLARHLPPGVPLLALGITITVLFHAVTMPLFRADDLAQAWQVIRGLLGGAALGERRLDPSWLFAWLGLTLVHGFVAWDRFPRWWRRVPDWIFAPGFGVACALVLACGAPLAAPFIYFQF